MRVHHNFLEDITLMSVLSVLGGLNNARAQLLFNLVYMAGRFFYGVGYVQSKTDGNGRFIGALILDVGKVATVVNAAWFGLSVAGYI